MQQSEGNQVQVQQSKSDPALAKKKLEQLKKLEDAIENEKKRYIESLKNEKTAKSKPKSKKK
jgi:hypothetical protein